MLVRKCYRYCLYPTNSQAEQLQWVLERCRELYNAALQERRDAYEMAGVRVTYYVQACELPGVKEDCPEFKQVGSQVLQDVLKRVDRAFQAFFRRVRAGDKPGYPRFKSRNRYDAGQLARLHVLVTAMRRWPMAAILRIRATSEKRRRLWLGDVWSQVRSRRATRCK